MFNLNNELVGKWAVEYQTGSNFSLVDSPRQVQEGETYPACEDNGSSSQGTLFFETKQEVNEYISQRAGKKLLPLEVQIQAVNSSDGAWNNSKPASVTYEIISLDGTELVEVPDNTPELPGCVLVTEDEAGDKAYDTMIDSLKASGYKEYCGFYRLEVS